MVNINTDNTKSQSIFHKSQKEEDGGGRGREEEQVERADRGSWADCEKERDSS